MEFRGCCGASVRFDKINAKLDKVLTTFGEIEALKEQICGLKETVEGLKTSLECTEKEIDYLKGEMAKTTQAVDDNTEDSKPTNDHISNWRPILGEKI